MKSHCYFIGTIHPFLACLEIIALLHWMDAILERESAALVFLLALSLYRIDAKHLCSQASIVLDDGPLRYKCIMYC